MPDPSSAVPARGTPIRVSARFRPSLRAEIGDDQDPLKNALIYEAPRAHIYITESSSGRAYKSDGSFFKTYPGKTSNQQVFNDMVMPMIPLVMAGKTCNFFAFGETGTGKTYTMLGDGPLFETEEEKKNVGLFYAAAEQLFQGIEPINKEIKESNSKIADLEMLGVVVRLYIVIKHRAADRLSNYGEIIYYDDPGDTKVLFPAKAEFFESYKDLAETIPKKLKQPAPESWPHRYVIATLGHTVMELELMNKSMFNLEEKTYPFRLQQAKIIHKINKLQYQLKTPETQNDPTLQAKIHADIDGCWDEFENYRKEVVDLHEAASSNTSSSPNQCVNGRITFVDLAGSEIFRDEDATSTRRATEFENGDLRKATCQALSVLTADMLNRVSHPEHPPVHQTTLMPVLREKMEAASKEGRSAMICTLSPLASDYDGTLSTIQSVEQVGALAHPEKRENQ